MYHSRYISMVLMDLSGEFNFTSCRSDVTLSLHETQIEINRDYEVLTELINCRHHVCFIFKGWINFFIGK
jgi:hypothetical protein